MCLVSNSYNVYFAKTFGICTSIMMSVVDSAYDHYASANGLNENGCFPLSRSYIKERTGLSESEQIQAEESLNSLGVLKVLPFRGNPSKNWYKYDPHRLEGGLCSISNSLINVPQEYPKPKKEKVKRATKREMSVISLKKSLKIENESIRQYFCDWIDSVYASPKKTLTSQSIEICVSELNEFSEEQEVQEEVMRIAIKNGWCDIKWAIKRYTDEKSKAEKTSANNWVNYESIQSDGSNISKEVF